MRRLPTPTEILRARNSWVAPARDKAGEPPGIRTKNPKLPGDLSEHERRVWRSLCRDLDNLGVLTESDKRAAYRYARYFCLWNELMDWLSVNGHFCTVPVGESGERDDVRPQSRRIDTLEANMLKIEDRFGLSPACRTKLRGESKEKSGSKAEKFFGKVSG